MKYFICIFFGIASALDEPNVTLADGTKVIGKLTKSVNNVTVWKFLGIPYAQPPIDQLRFMPPQPLATKKDVIYATEFSPICQQNVDGSYLEKWIIEQQISVSEDCLYLNVWVPKKANEQSALPVMVWIHGGGFYAGSSRNPVTEGTTLAARENVILVSMNYRLSVFGFAFAGIPEAPGNMGLLDQLEALKWVKVNIASFGGNPEAITLFGVSAGGASVSLHGLSPISRPFFNRIIAQSGVASNPWATRSGESIKRSLLQCATVVNCYSSGKGAPDFAAIVGCLKTKTPDELLRTFRSLSDELLLITFVPVVDGHFLLDKPENMLNSGSLPPLDMLLGTVSNEAGIFLYVYFSEYFKYSHMGTLNISSEDYKTMVKASIPPNQRENPLIVKATLFEYDDQADSFLRASALANLIGDIHFDAGAEHTARRYTSTNVNVYRYVFNYENTEMKLPWMKCPHASDEPFVFGYPLLNPKVEKNRIKMSKVMMRFWANFARTGNPNLNVDGTMTSIKWPNYGDKSAFALLNNKINTHSYAYRRRQTRFWNSYLPDVFNLTGQCFNISNYSYMRNVYYNPNLNVDGTMTSIKWPNYGDKSAFALLNNKINTHSYAYRRRQTRFWNSYLPDVFNLTGQCFNISNYSYMRNVY